MDPNLDVVDVIPTVMERDARIELFPVDSIPNRRLMPARPSPSECSRRAMKKPLAEILHRNAQRFFNRRFSALPSIPTSASRSAHFSPLTLVDYAKINWVFVPYRRATRTRQIIITGFRYWTYAEFDQIKSLNKKSTLFRVICQGSFSMFEQHEEADLVSIETR